MKSKRQEKILELIEKYDIETQEELIARLAECGIQSKQTTVSRDIKELYLYKEPLGGGRSRYAVSGRADHIDNTRRLQLILNECSVGVDCAGIVVLLKTLPGLADAAGAAIDAMRLPQMLGCISGNDSVAIIARGEQECSLRSISARSLRAIRSNQSSSPHRRGCRRSRRSLRCTLATARSVLRGWCSFPSFSCCSRRCLKPPKAKLLDRY